MATTTVTGVAVDGNGTPYAARLVVTVVSSEAGLYDGDGNVIADRSHIEFANADGTYAVACERQSGITNDGSTPVTTTTTIQVGTGYTAAGLTIPDSGPVTLASLIPSSTDHTVAVTTKAVDDSEAGIANLSVPAILSTACWNLNGDLLLPSHPFQPTADSLGNILWRLDRTDQLTPLDPGVVEPYYRFTFGPDAVVLKKVHGAGTLATMPNALAASTGTFAATDDDLPHTSNLTVLPDDANPTPGTLNDDLQILNGRTDYRSRTITASTAVSPTDKMLFVDLTAGNITVTLEHVADRVQPLDLSIINAAHTLTILAQSGETVNGFASITGNTINEWFCVVPQPGTTNYIADVGASTGMSSVDSSIVLDFRQDDSIDLTTALVAASGWQDFGPERTFTVTDDAVVLVLNALGNAIMGQNVDCRFVLDSAGTPVFVPYKGASASGFMNVMLGTAMTMNAGVLTAGAHTVKVQVNPAADDTLFCRTTGQVDGGAPDGNRESFGLQVLCITRSGGGGGGGGVDPTAVHLNPASPESGDMNVTGLLTIGSINTGAITATQIHATTHVDVDTYLHVARIHNGGGAAIANPNTASPGGGTGCTMTLDSGSATLDGWATLTTGTTPGAAAHLGEVNFTATLDDPASCNGTFFGMDAASAALLPYCVNKSDGTGIELWVVVDPDPSTVYRFAYHCLGA